MRSITVNANVPVQVQDSVVRCNCLANAITVTLYSAQHRGKMVTIKKIDSSTNAVTISPYGSETIDGAASYTLTAQHQYVTLISTVDGWDVVDSYTVLNTPKIADGDDNVTINSADQTHATPVVTIPDIGDAADTFVMADTTQTLTNKTLTSPTITSPTLNLKTATPVNAVAATGTLTVSGVAVDGETVTIGADVYEFAADAAQTVTGSNIAVDIAADTTASQGTLTVDTQPTAGDTMTIGAKVYTFTADGTAAADGEIDVGADLAGAKVNIVAAINGTDGVNTAHTLVSAAAFALNACVITALIGGVAGDLIATTETFTAGTNIFDAATLGTTTPGADCSAANAVTALVTALTASDTQGVGAADGAGDTVVLTADTKGAAANSIATTETMANGAFAAATLEGGVNGTVGSQWEIRVDGSYIYICVAANTIADGNWERAAIATY